jgi:type II secretory pathway pseudopilin PulG
MSRNRIERRGAALLEAIVALTILGIAGISALTMAGEAARSVDRAREAESSLREASAFFEAVALWPRDDLDRRLGDRTQGPWLLRIERPERELYLIVLADTLTGEALLATSLFRPEPRDALD